MHFQIGNQTFAGPSVRQLQEQLDAFKAGLETGKAWPARWNHAPGGPFVWNEDSRQAHVRWMKGFAIGVSLNPDLPADHPARKTRRY